MHSHEIKLVSKVLVAKDTMSFNFAKPKNFKFIAGQYCDWFIKSVPKSNIETGIRSLSLSSAPFEKELTITIRLRSSEFKKSLMGFTKGTKITMNGPQGDLILDHSKNPLILIAGGVGVTPFRSIVQQANSSKLKRKIFLFHFNKLALDTPFLDEFQKISNINFQYIPIFTRDKNWSGETGYLSGKLLIKYFKNPRILYKSQYYLSGKPEMVREAKKTILTLGINEEAIRQEEFDGY